MSQTFSQQKFDALRTEISAAIVATEGHLSDHEVDFLTLASAVPSATGEVLEIGSFKGKSTIVLAKSAKHAGDAHTGLWACDPFTSPTVTCPDLEEDSSFSDFERNLRSADVTADVRVFQDYSDQLALTWNTSLRLLWIDGDHTFAGAKKDFDNFSPWLVDGAIIAFHDTLHSHDGPCRVFANDILLSPHYGACGFCGSIAWARYSSKPITDETIKQRKLQLYRQLTHLVALTALDQDIAGWRKVLYRWSRTWIPHGPMSLPSWKKWLAMEVSS
ncbi:MAG: class I SAM-dependent methyltransferase [Mariprofundaceae bacterium]|nr:class I SAM-dependent methyltransferase [Mariprofundaceae bacterium]